MRTIVEQVDPALPQHLSYRPTTSQFGAFSTSSGPRGVRISMPTSSSLTTTTQNQKKNTEHNAIPASTIPAPVVQHQNHSNKSRMNFSPQNLSKTRNEPSYVRALSFPKFENDFKHIRIPDTQLSNSRILFRKYRCAPFPKFSSFHILKLYM